MQFKNGNPSWAKTSILIAICALGLFGFTADLHAESNQAGSKQAVLHISVVVMPVIQDLNAATPLAQNGPVTYSLETAPREKTFEVRPLPPEMTAHTDKHDSAILKTLVVVPQ
jgi:hypothetical protein